MTRMVSFSSSILLIGDNKMGKEEVKSLIKRLEEAEFDAEMWQGCSAMVRDTLIGLGCKCGEDSHKATPPMNYPEWIHCVVKSRVDEYKSVLDKLPRGADEQPLYMYYEGYVYTHYEVDGEFLDGIHGIGIIKMIEGHDGCPYCMCTVRDSEGREWEIEDNEIFDSIDAVETYQKALKG